MCGKDLSGQVDDISLTGSPPHVRERHYPHGSGDLNGGITPACAGKTQHVIIIVDKSRDHPRMCGKDCRYTCHTEMIWGSPPHVRERLGIGQLYFKVDGITPACAGKTLSPRHI